MQTDETHRQFRTVCHMAASELERLGYTVAKTATRSWPYDLIAFNGNHTLFISTRRGRTHQTEKQIILMNQHVIADMQNTPTPHHTEKQFWMYYQGNFVVYKLFEHGMMKIKLHKQQ